MNIPKEIITEDGYRLTYSHSVELRTLTDIEKKLINLEELKMRGMLEPVGVLYSKNYTTYRPYKLHIYSYSEMEENK